LPRLAAALVGVGLMLAADLYTKSWAATELRARGPRRLGPVMLRYQENGGTVFGWLREGGPGVRPVLVAYSAVVSLVLAVLLVRRRRATAATVLGLAAMLAGSLGNLCDRVARGFVVDFIGLPRWPSFNVADLVLAAGMAACLAGLLIARARAV
jgi:signal peptidase II